MAGFFSAVGDGTVQQFQRPTSHASLRLPSGFFTPQSSRLLNID
jgi:hypothetical protein